MFAKNIINGLLDSILSAHCELCGDATESMLCAACATQLPRIKDCCEICSLPLEHSSPHEYNDETELDICGECLRLRPDFDKLIAPFVYKDEIAWLINKFKHRSRAHFGDYLSQHLYRELQDHLRVNEKPDLITAVPLHWTRLLHRGFNQSELLARCISEHIEIPYQNILHKRKRTAKQQNLERKSRLQNLRNAFQLKENVEGKFISIVDDVVTTGATAQTLASLLVDAGARRIEVWALARTPKPE